MEGLLDSRTMSLVISSKFVRKKRFKLKKIKRSIEREDRDRCSRRTEVECNLGNAIAIL